MATSAVAQEIVFALRRKIARIEGTLPERLVAPAGAQPTDETMVLRRHGVTIVQDLLHTGAENFDRTLGGGLPRAALTEIHGVQTRDAGAVAGFGLALAGRLMKDAVQPKLPVLWIGTHEIFREAGFPYAPGLHARFGIAPDDLIFAQASKLADAMWIAEEAASLKALSAVLLEIRGNPEKLDLVATRRLHHRAQDAGRPVFLLRQAAQAEPTAAPVRLVVSPAPATLRRTIAGPLPGSIGPPGFTVRIDKSRTALPGQFTLEWNADERSFEERRPAGLDSANPVAVVPAPSRRADIAPAPGTVLAFEPTDGAAASRHQPSREQHKAHRSPRRTG
jgi:protein ImuA